MKKATPGRRRHRARGHKTSLGSISSSRKTSDSDRHKTSVIMFEKVHRTYVAPGGPSQTSDEDLPEDLTRIEIDMRHYCRWCKRKRAERHMKIIGTGAFGKKSWACNDNKSICRQIAAMKFP